MAGSKKSLLPRMAIGSNVSEDTDDKFDDLFKKYGKVVFQRKEQKSAIEEVDDDAESLSVMWLYIYFFPNKGISTIWKSSMAMQRLSSCLLRTKNPFR